MNNNYKCRNWAFILYLDSAPSNWRDILQDTGLPIAISPYHDLDINPTGETKKPHYHIILCFEGPTTYKNVKRITDSVNATIPQPLSAIKGYYRYFTHKDNPEKYQYNEKDITTINGFNIDDYVELTYLQVQEILKQIFCIIDEKNILEYYDLITLLNNEDTFDLLNVATSHTILLNTLITSKRHKQKKTN